MKRKFWIAIVALIATFAAGYGLGVWQWRGMAVIESYALGLEHDFNAGIAEMPGAEVITINPDGSTTTRRNPR